MVAAAMVSTTVDRAIGSGLTTSPHDEAREREHRAAANRAIVVSALGLALTGAIELAIALFTASVALLADALHNLSDVSTSLAVSRYKRHVAQRIHCVTMEAEANHAWLDMSLPSGS